MNLLPIRTPSAVLPLALSAAALALVVGHALVYGVVHEADEGTAAHVFQLLLVAQVPIVLWFTVRWLPREPRAAVRTLVLQACAVAAALASVSWLT